MSSKLTKSSYLGVYKGKKKLRKKAFESQIDHVSPQLDAIRLLLFVASCSKENTE